MDTNTTVAIVILIGILIVAAIGWIFYQQRRSQELRQKFGPEYQRTVEAYGDQHRAEAELAAREKRVRKLEIHPLEPNVQDRFAQQWKDVQAQFVDNPSAAVKEADRLVIAVMEARGYPIGDFEQRAADISVDHPNVVTNYRAARDIALANRQGRATTEDLRQALVHYRALFEDLLESTTNAPQETEVVRS